MDPLSFFVPGLPVGKGRPRFVRSTGRVYTPAETEKAEENIRAHAARAMNGGALIEQPVELRVIAYYLPPKTRTKRARSLPCAGFKPSRPDWDNIGKLVSDSLNGVVLRDDAQISVAHVAKVYGDRPGLRVSVHPLSFMSWPFVGGVTA